MAGQSHSEHPHERAPLPDDTPPRNGLIAMYTVLGVATLFSLHFVFSSYFVISAEGRMYTSRLSTPPTQLREMRADEAARAERGAMPIRRAMEQLARSGRVGSTISPMPSDDVGALEGWTQDLQPARAAAARAAMALVTADAGVDAAVDPDAATDGGVAIPADAGIGVPFTRELPTTRETPEERPSREAEAHPPRAPRPRPTPAEGAAPVEPPPPAAPPAEQPTN